MTSPLRNNPTFSTARDTWFAASTVLKSTKGTDLANAPDTLMLARDLFALASTMERLENDVPLGTTDATITDLAKASLELQIAAVVGAADLVRDAVGDMTNAKHERITMTLGRAIGTDGDEVSDSHMTRFLAMAVTSAVKSFTVTEASGYWEGDAERTTIVSVVTNDRGAYGRLEKVAGRYCRMFRQDCVMMERADCGAPAFVDTGK